MTCSSKIPQTVPATIERLPQLMRSATSALAASDWNALEQVLAEQKEILSHLSADSALPQGLALELVKESSIFSAAMRRTAIAVRALLSVSHAEALYTPENLRPR